MSARELVVFVPARELLSVYPHTILAAVKLYYCRIIVTVLYVLTLIQVVNGGFLNI